MDQQQEQDWNNLPGDEAASAEAGIVYPPKFRKEEEAQSNVWLRSFISLALYLVLGYYIFHSFVMLLIITGIVVIHELGHFFAMKFFRYKDLGIFFIPLLGAYVSGSKREVSQKESAIILLAGPLPGILIGVICHVLWEHNPSLYIGPVSLDRVGLLFMLLNLINLLPVYPLDGGQLLNRVFLDEEGWISRIFVILSAGLLIWVAWSLYSSSGQPFYFILFLFPLMMLLRLQTDSKYKSIEKRIENEGINADVSYEELPDKDYWHIRRILIEDQAAFKDVDPDPAAGYDEKEEKIMATVQGLLHRHLIQDVSLIGKLLILVICAAAFASPWLLNMDLSFFRQFGF